MPTDPGKIFPPIPPSDSLPFYFSSVSSIWMYYRVPVEKVTQYFDDIALEPALFDGYALVLLNFQRYTGFLAFGLSTVNEVQLNIVAYPSVLSQQTPAISLADLLAGGETTKTIGAYRLYVPADNPFAVAAGRDLFNEPTFQTTFTYTVPTLNDLTQQAWDVTCNDPTTASESIFTLHVPAHPNGLAPAALAPIMQYTRDPEGRVFAYTWNLFGTFLSGPLDANAGATLTFGTSTHPMRIAMQALLEGAPAVGMQTFETPPVATSTRGYLLQPEELRG